MKFTVYELWFFYLNLHINNSFRENIHEQRNFHLRIRPFFRLLYSHIFEFKPSNRPILSTLVACAAIWKTLDERMKAKYMNSRWRANINSHTCIPYLLGSLLAVEVFHSFVFIPFSSFLFQSRFIWLSIYFMTLAQQLLHNWVNTIKCMAFSLNWEDKW